MRTLTLVVLVVFAAIVATNAFPSNDEARREATEENIVNYLRQMKAEKRQPGGGRGFGGRKNENDNDDDDDDNDNDNDDDDNNGNRLGWRKGDDDNDNDDDDDDNSGNRLGWRKGDDDDDDDDNSGIGWDDKKGSGWGKWDSEKDDDDKNDDDDDGKLGTTANPWWFSEVGSSANPFPWWWFQTESPGNPWWSSETGSSESPWQMGSSPEPNLDMSGWDDMWDGIFAGQNSEGTDEEPEPEAATESPIANVLKVLGNIQQALGKKEKK